MTAWSLALVPPQTSKYLRSPKESQKAANRAFVAYLGLTVSLFVACYLAFDRYGFARVDLVSLLLVKLALIVAASALFVRFRALRWSSRHARAVEELAQSRIELVDRLACAAEYRDDATGSHNRRIGLYALAVARRLGMDAPRGDLLAHAAVLHDVGKIGVPDAILLKPGPLDPAERTTMERHTAIGGALLSGSPDPLIATAQRIALAHHENWDGTGYPEGLAGEAIPVEARIVAICDVFDALTSARPYKEAWSPERAFEEIRRLSGTKFDPAVVAAFFACEPEILKAYAAPDEGPWVRFRLADPRSYPMRLSA